VRRERQLNLVYSGTRAMRDLTPPHGGRGASPNPRGTGTVCRPTGYWILGWWGGAVLRRPSHPGPCGPVPAACSPLSGVQRGASAASALRISASVHICLIMSHVSCGFLWMCLVSCVLCLVSCVQLVSSCVLCLVLSAWCLVLSFNFNLV
jgi:hypothetical protein